MKKEKKQKKPKNSLKNKRLGVYNFSDYKKPGYKILYGVFIFLLIIFALVAITPILWLFITSFKTVTEINSTNYRLFPEVFNIKKIADVWNKMNLLRYYGNTLIVVAGAIVCSVIFNGLLAYVTGIIKPAGYKVIHVLVLLAYMMPSAIAIVPLFVAITDLGMINSYIPLCLTFGANAYYYMLLKNSFERTPKEIIEAAQIDGLGDFRIFFRIIVPLNKSIIGVVAIFTMTAAYSDFLLPMLVLQDGEMATIMVHIYNLGTQSVPMFDTSEFLMLLMISMIPQIILFMIFQKQILGGLTKGGVKG
ncbi:MAG: carbohydrate ABC transporter permease [Bacilli bacterium]|jgi:multiple sugar transport system permease protein